MTKKMASIAVVIALLGGLVIGGTIGGTPGAFAHTTQQDVEAELSVRDVLVRLVADETLTQEQADAVERALAESRPLHGFRHGDRRGTHRGAAGSGLGGLADLLDLDRRELRSALQDGATVGDLAAAAGLTTDDVVGAMLARVSERLDVAVSNGHIDEVEAAERLARFESRARDLVNGDGAFADRLLRRIGRSSRETIPVPAGSSHDA